MRERDIKFMKHRQEIMNEYYMDMKKYVKEFEEVATLNEDILGKNPYESKMNLDNFPTHTDSEGKEYCAASKNYKLVDPECSDVRSMHYASEDRTYLVVKNKFTDQWEFPTGRIFLGQTFLRAKQDLFIKYATDKWRVRFFGSMPCVHTIRDFSEAEL